MAISQEALETAPDAHASALTPENVEIHDPNAGTSLRERWQMSADTFPARVTNMLLRSGEGLFKLRSEMETVKTYYGDQPRTLRERAHRISNRLNPNLLNLQLGHKAADLETEVVRSVRDKLSQRFGK